MKQLILLLLMPVLGSAQLALFSFDGTTEAPVGGTFNYGNVESGDSVATRFRARNLGNSAVQLTTLSIAGAGFKQTAVNGSVPGVIAPGNFLEFTITFTAGVLASYSASLQVNSIGVLLLAVSVPAPVVTVVKPCLLDSTTSAVSFPSAAIGSNGSCNFVVQNPGNQALLVSTLAVTGDVGFQGPQGVQAPVTLAAGQSISFSVQFKPVCGRLTYAGVLTMNTHTFPLNATGIAALLPKPAVTFDNTAFGSAQQRTLTMALPSAAVCAATGYVNLVFTPMAGTGKTDDASVFFLAGSVRTLPIAIAANTTQISINGQSSASFQTGTTAGSIVFSISNIAINGDATTTITIPPLPVFVSSTAASTQRLGELDIQVIGFDNTFSAGAMSFTFFDAKGNAIGSAVTADFTSAFKTYFASQTGGSTFLMRISFPVQGDQTLVATVQATFSNSAGQTQTGTLTFQ